MVDDTAVHDFFPGKVAHDSGKHVAVKNGIAWTLRLLSILGFAFRIMVLKVC